MFEQETVLVLGAGASWHYGYPTGETLVGDVISLASSLGEYCNRRSTYWSDHDHPNFLTLFEQSQGRGSWSYASRQFSELAERLRAVDPVVIDYFLSWNKDLRDIGRMVIAGVLLNHEQVWENNRTNINRRLAFEKKPLRPNPEEMARFDISVFKDSWYRFIVHKLAYGCKEFVRSPAQ